MQDIFKRKSRTIGAVVIAQLQQRPFQFAFNKMGNNMTIANINSVPCIITRCAAGVSFKSKLFRENPEFPVKRKPYVTVGMAIQYDPEFEQVSQVLIRNVSRQSRIVKDYHD